MEPRTLLIRRTTWEAEGVLSLLLEDPSGEPLPGWAPGAHLDLEIPGGYIRPYSLCGDVGERGSWRVAILREEHGRGGSRAAHEGLRAGMTLRVVGLRSNFPLVPAPGYLFVVGGIGITPILPMIAAVAGGPAPWTLLYGGRRRASMAFLGELTAHGDRVTVVPEDVDGRLDLKTVIGAAAADTAVYCCGPEALIDAVESVCQDHGRPAPYVERFRPTSAQDTTGEVNGGFDVVAQRSGVRVRVPPNLSVLDAVERAGLTPLSSCREGYCGTCEVRVLSGEVDHRDEYLSTQARAAGRSMMICVSRAPGEVVLDI